MSIEENTPKAKSKNKTYATLRTKASALAAQSSNTQLIRETVILAILLSYPALIEEFTYQIQKIEFEMKIEKLEQTFS